MRITTMPREYWDHWLATSVHQKTAIHMPFVKEMLQRGISSMLDAGSGRGQRIKELAQLGFRITCVDASLTAVTHLRHLSEDPSIKHLNIVRADVLSLPFSNDSFGAALCFGVLNFFTEVSDRRRAFTEIFRVVKPGGIMLFTLMSTEDEGMKRGQLLGNSNVQLPDGVCLHYFLKYGLPLFVKRRMARER